MRFLCALALVASTLLVGCATTKSRPFQEVKLGMDKSQVLEIIGNPSRSSRIKGSDRWSYDDFSQGDREVVNIYFTEGKVSFLGTDAEYEARLKPAAKPSSKNGSFQEL